MNSAKSFSITAPSGVQRSKRNTFYKCDTPVWFHGRRLESSFLILYSRTFVKGINYIVPKIFRVQVLDNGQRKTLETEEEYATFFHEIETQ